MNNCYILLGISVISIILLAISLIYLYKKDKKESYCGCGQRFSFPYEVSANLPAQGLGGGYGRYPSCMCQK